MSKETNHNQGLRPVQTEIQLGVCGPEVSDAELKRIQERVDAEVSVNEYNQERLEAEEQRGEPLPIAERRQRLRQRIIDNVVFESPHRHYFVRQPGL